METIMLKTADINPHTNNPRKDLGDLSELTESIKKNGIMQNLTVIPVGDKFKRYMALIGHRRLAAAKEAGLEEVPCIIRTDISEQEQVAIMLEENMQRNDLTPIEQAYGFQMVLDLGGNEEMLAEKTGFSKQTIRHRLEIAKLDKKILDQHEKGESWQLSMKDLIELEKIEDVKERNHLLRTCENSDDLTYMIDKFLRKKKKNENRDAYIKALEALGIKEATDDLKKNRYSNKWEEVASFILEEKPGAALEKKVKGAEYYIIPGEYDYYICVYRKTTNKKITKHDKAEQERKRKEEELKKLDLRMRKERKAFVLGIIDRKYGKPKDHMQTMESLIDVAISLNARMYDENIGEYITGKRYYQQTEEQKEKIRAAKEKMTATDRLLILADYAAYEGGSAIRWDGKHDEERAVKIRKYHEALSSWGYKIKEEEIKKMLDGTHKNYGGKDDRK